MWKCVFAHLFSFGDEVVLVDLAFIINSLLNCSGPTKSFSPAALAVEEVDEEEFLCGPELHPLSESENVPRRLRNLHPVVLTRRPPQSGVHDLRRPNTTEGWTVSEAASPD